MNLVEFAYKMKDMASGPLGKIAGAFDAADESAQRATRSASMFEKLSAGAFGINNIIGVVQSAVSAVQQFTDANQAQQEAEAKLAQVMRNTMDASDAEIQSIKDLTAAQQALGIVGDEVQLAGAQELGTYLEQTDSLKALIPVMNDMVAQQYGFNATQESAVNIATMMGKVMEGQVGALSRYGYKFDEAQEQILKYGTEAEKVATLTEVIGESVGGMNVALAQTPEGQMKQLSNTLGDMKEKVGASIMILADAFMPALKGAISVFEGLVNVVHSFAEFISNNIPLVLGFTGAIAALTVATKGAAIAAKAAEIATAAWSAAQTVLNAIMHANPIGLIIAAVSALIGLVVTIIKKWDEWGAAVSLLILPIGLVISAIKSFKANWDSVVNAFKTDGILGGLKRIGQVLLDAMLMPVQQLLELLAKIPGLGHLAAGGAAKIAQLRKNMNTLPAKQEEKTTSSATAADSPTNKKLEEIAKNTKANASAGASASKAVASSGPKVVNINVTKFFDNIEFNTTSLQESAGKIEEVVLEVLSRVLVQGAAQI